MKQFLSRLGKAMGLMLSISGAIVTGILLLAIILGHLSGGWLVLTMPLLIGIGVLPLGLGMVLLYASAKLAQAAIRDRFHYMLQLGTGRVSLLGFSNAARLEPSIARQYLDAWARECDATFDVTDDGDIYYVFSSQPLSLPGGRSTTPFLEKLMQKLV
jgi:hypothetical protein